ncbi:MAG: hypothetical protein QGD94_05030, partial [Planctomycetia bacterium]|nr:hypothetical protein [Planctomycetia bacterium]
MPTFHMDGSNFDQCQTSGIRVLQAGAKLDFDEMSADQDTLALYHLHDDLLDDSGNGYDLTNHG